MLVHLSVNHPIALPDDWSAKWEGPDGGLIASWSRGLEKRAESPDLADKARAGELPVLAWRGGVEKPIKGEKSGTLLYLAAWQGLRGDDLHIDTAAEVRLTCARHGVPVVYSAHIPTDGDHDP